MKGPRKIITAGHFVFQIGPTKAGDSLGVVRIGGHREEHETSWQCAVREAFEETSARVTLQRPPATYWFEASDLTSLHRDAWDVLSPDEVAPILVGLHKDEHMTPMYLGSSHDEPRPAAEAKGLLLLSPLDVSRFAQREMTLGQYLETGGRAILRERLPEHLVLEPLPQLLLLSVLLEMHPRLGK